MTDIHGFEVGKTVYALQVLGRRSCCEAPSMLFAMRGDELIIEEIIPPSKYDSKTWYVCRQAKGGTPFHVTAGCITTMKHFNHNLDEVQRWADLEKAREYRGD